MTYNADGSDFFNLAKSLSKKWEEKFSKLRSDLNLDSISSSGGAGGSSGSGSGGVGGIGGGSASDSKVSLDDKRAFARSLYKMTKEDLGKLIVEVDTKCPAALTKNAGEDECEFNVDKLPPSVFQELKIFVATCGKSQPAKKKASSSSSKRQKTS